MFDDYCSIERSLCAQDRGTHAALARGDGDLLQSDNNWIWDDHDYYRCIKTNKAGKTKTRRVKIVFE